MNIKVNRGQVSIRKGLIRSTKSSGGRIVSVETISTKPSNLDILKEKLKKININEFSLNRRNSSSKKKMDKYITF